MIRRSLLPIVLALSMTSVATAQSTPSAPVLSGISFLVGTWVEGSENVADTGGESLHKKSTDELSAHQIDVQKKSMHVMPFGMNATRHIFTPTADGGSQTVVVINGDAKQLPLVRSHLKKEAAAFARGNFSDPASIHGASMPGLKMLETSRGRLMVRYVDVGNGAKIVFRSTSASVVTALHQWFAAQVDDHGPHASMKM